MSTWTIPSLDASTHVRAIAQLDFGGGGEIAVASDHALHIVFDPDGDPCIVNVPLVDAYGFTIAGIDPSPGLEILMDDGVPQILVVDLMQ